jgi:putative membrane protein
MGTASPDFTPRFSHLVCRLHRPEQRRKIYMFRRSHIVVCAAAAVFATAGWAQMQPPTQPPSGPPGGTPQTPMPNATGATTQDQQMDPYLTDKDFVRNAAEATATEVHLGKIAQEKGSSDAVKELGKQMVESNTQTGEQLQQAATALKMALPADPPKRAKKAEEKLAKLSGADFDKAYTKMAVDEQKQAVKEFEREAKDGKATSLKDYAAKNLPAVQERQKKAEELAATGK